MWTGAIVGPHKCGAIVGPFKWTNQHKPPYSQGSQSLAPIRMDWTIGSIVQLILDSDPCLLLIKRSRLVTCRRGWLYIFYPKRNSKTFYRNFRSAETFRFGGQTKTGYQTISQLWLSANSKLNSPLSRLGSRDRQCNAISNTAKLDFILFWPYPPSMREGP